MPEFFASDYPHPKSISDGPWALLTGEQKRFATAQRNHVNDFVAGEKQKAVEGFFEAYTGLESYPPALLQELKKKLEDNKTWEEVNGPLMFDSPEYPQQLVDYREPRPVPIPLHTVAPMSPAAEAWIVKWKTNVVEQQRIRHTQVLKWIRENKFRTLKNHVNRVVQDTQERDGPIPWLFKAPAPQLAFVRGC